MTPCPFEQHLDALLDDELSAPRQEELERHVQACPTCAAALEELRSLSGWLKSAPQPHLSQIARARLHARVDDAANEQALVRVAHRLAAIAACVLVAGSAWLTLVPHAQHVQQTAQAAPPPWVGVTTAVAEMSTNASPERQTPAAQWYLADASRSNADEIP
jgi:anti-sigma factor RsiW